MLDIKLGYVSTLEEYGHGNRTSKVHTAGLQHESKTVCWNFTPYFKNNYSMKCKCT
jgi:hypothetical protein